MAKDEIDVDALLAETVSIAGDLFAEAEERGVIDKRLAKHLTYNVLTLNNAIHSGVYPQKWTPGRKRIEVDDLSDTMVGRMEDSYRRKTRTANPEKT